MARKRVNPSYRLRTLLGRILSGVCVVASVWAAIHYTQSAITRAEQAGRVSGYSAGCAFGVHSLASIAGIGVDDEKLATFCEKAATQPQ